MSKNPDAQRRYNHSAKGKARAARYNHSVKRKQALARYNASSTGQARTTRYEATTARKAKKREVITRRIRIGDRSAGYARTHEELAVIQAHIRRRLDAFKSGQSARAQAQSAAAGAVSLETEL